MTYNKGKADSWRGPLLHHNTREDDRLWVQLAKKLRRQGYSYQRIADELHISYRRVYRALNYDRVLAWNANSPSNQREARNTARRQQRQQKKENDARST